MALASICLVGPWRMVRGQLIGNILGSAGPSTPQLGARCLRLVQHDVNAGADEVRRRWKVQAASLLAGGNDSFPPKGSIILASSGSHTRTAVPFGAAYTAPAPAIHRQGRIE